MEGSGSDVEGGSQEEKNVQASAANVISHSDVEEDSLAAATLGVIVRAQKSLQAHCPAGSQQVFATHSPDQTLFPKAHQEFCQAVELLEESFCKFLKVWWHINNNIDNRKLHYQKKI